MPTPRPIHPPSGRVARGAGALATLCAIALATTTAALAAAPATAPVTTFAPAPARPADHPDGHTLVLDGGWSLQTSAQVRAPGAELSQPGWKPNDWHEVTVPTTVVAALLKNKVFTADPFFGMNLRQLPGVSYDVGANFSNIEMPAGSPFRVPWWYRKQFTLPAGYQGKTVWLKLDGLNYRANVWLNGKQVGTAARIAGAWRTFDLDVTTAARPGAVNVLAVEVFPQQKEELGITFVDWNPTPPDKNLGLWRQVRLISSGPLAIRYPAVLTHLVPQSGKDAGKDGPAAELTVTALVKNASAQAVTGVLRGRLLGVSFEQEVTLGAGEKRDVVFEPAKFPQLRVARPALWWPAQMSAQGKPALHQLDLALEVDGKRSDATRTSFGIREMKSELDQNRRRWFSVNGKRVLIRGGGWSSDMMMREDPRRQEDELRYVLDMGLNTVRLEGKLESEGFLDYTDRNGILVMAGWCCCDHWEKWKSWDTEDHDVAAESQRDQLYRLRGRASVFTWLNASDGPPPPPVEKRYLEIARQVRWPNPVVSSAHHKDSELTGPSGVKMQGPYEWVPPRYWLEDTRKGGAYGFNTETSPGPAVPPIESLRRMLPPDKLWPINEHWDFHAGGGQFKTVKVHTAALEARYGKATGAEDYAQKSQLMAYEGIRAMFEAFSRNKYTSTGVVQWMLNNAWPGIIWHLYDYFLLPGGGYFGAKKACQPLLPLYSYTDGTVWAVNSTYEEQRGLTLTARVLDLGMQERFRQQVKLDLPADGTHSALTIPPLRGLSATYFIHLELADAAGKPVGTNFYWMSTRPDVLAHEKAEWFVTPTSGYADFTALSQLPAVKLKVDSRSARKGVEGTTTVKLRNPSATLAFFVRLKVVKGKGGDEVAPVLWEDNYVSLLPGETRTLTARYRAGDLGGKPPQVEVTGWNVAGR
jgi:exo-1,4-beta-D-glucosaminidase